MKIPTVKQHEALLETLLKMQSRVDKLARDWDEKCQTEESEISQLISCVSAALETAMDEIDEQAEAAAA